MAFTAAGTTVLTVILFWRNFC